MSKNLSLLEKFRAQTSIDKIRKQMDGLKKQSNFRQNEAVWRPATDKAGNGYAVIRLLPAPADEDTSIIKLFNHGFKGPTGEWYIENSLTTLGQKDPVSEMNFRLWESYDDKTKQERGRRTKFLSNAYIKKDINAPENEGKVLVYMYGQKIFEKFDSMMNPPEHEQRDPQNPFDFDKGMDFIIRVKQKNKFPNYDDSSFDVPSRFLNGDDEALEKVLGQLHSLKQFIAPDQFKSYSDLKARLNQVLDGSDETKDSEDTPPWEDQPTRKTTTRPSISEEDEDPILAQLRQAIADSDD